MFVAAARPPVDLLTIRTPAKLNLSLRVFRLRSDGFHELRSLVVGLALYDELLVGSAKSGCDEFACDVDKQWCAGSLPADEDNLVRKAISACREHGLEVPPLRVTLKKVIPIGGGLGGGSGNAAGVIAGLNERLDWGLSSAELASIGSRVGSDVALFFSLPAAVMSGRGERVQAVSPAWSGWVTLVFGGMAVSTAKTYAAWDELHQGNGPAHQGETRCDSTTCGGPTVDGTTVDGTTVDGTASEWSVFDGEGEVRSLLAADTAEALSPLLVNDLEEAVYAVVPEVKELHERVSRAGGPPARLSGAGATIYQLFNERDQAEQHLRRLREYGIDQPMLVAQTHVCPVISF